MLEVDESRHIALNFDNHTIRFHCRWAIFRELILLLDIKRPWIEQIREQTTTIQAGQLTISTGGLLMIGVHCIGIFSNGSVRITYQSEKEPTLIPLYSGMAQSLAAIQQRRRNSEGVDASPDEAISMTGSSDRDTLDEIHRFLVGAAGLEGIILPA